MRSGEIPVEEYVIKNRLTKPPEAYDDGISQPHVQVSPDCITKIIYLTHASSRRVSLSLVWFLGST